MPNMENTMDEQTNTIRFVGWEADMAELVAEKLGLSLEGLCALLLRPEACDAEKAEAAAN